MCLGLTDFSAEDNSKFTMHSNDITMLSNFTTNSDFTIDRDFTTNSDSTSHTQ